MTLLDDIVSGASGTAAVSTLLRQLKVLASRTATDRLDAWVTSELTGYPDAMALPPYRGPFDVVALGHFVGSFQSEARNVQIAPSTFPADMREGSLFKLWLLAPVAELEQMASGDFVQLAWPPDAVRYYNYGVQQGTIQRVVREDMVLVSVVRPVPVHVFVGALDAVRTKILELALELEQVVPTAGQLDASADVRGQAAQIINTYNFNASSNVAINSSGISQTVHLPSSGDQAGLLRYLGAAGVEPERLVALQEALRLDEAEAGAGVKSRWTRVRSWFAAAATDVGTNAIGGSISAAATAFLG